MIAFLGTGLLGANFVRALIKRGEEVRVWNRTADKARALEAEGAKAFADPAEAVKGATRIHVCVSDDAAVDEVLERARPGFATNVVIVDHTTTLATGTVARVAKWNERGIAFQHAPVFMGPKEALDSTGIMLASGDKARFDALAPHLEKMTGKLVYLGEEPGRAAGFKLMGNLFLMSLVGGMRDMLGLARSLGVPPNEAAQLIDWFNPGVMLGARMKKMIGGDFSRVSWELAMARKDARLMIEEAEKGGLPLMVMPGMAQAMDRLIEKGHGKEDWMVIAKDVVSK